MEHEEYKYVCIKPSCSARYPTPQEYCRVCHSDVELEDKAEGEEDEAK